MEITSIFSSCDRSAMEITSIFVSKVHPFAPRFLITHDFFLKENRIQLTPQILLQVFEEWIKWIVRQRSRNAIQPPQKLSFLSLNVSKNIFIPHLNRVLKIPYRLIPLIVSPPIILYKITKLFMGESLLLMDRQVH